MRIRWNESDADARGMFVVVYDVDGALAAPESVPASMLYYCDGSSQMVAATGAWVPRTKPLVVADFTFTADSGTDQIAHTAHTLKTGDGPIFPSTSGSFAGSGITAASPYYVVRIDDDHFKIATSRANALAGTTVDILGAGTGTHTFADSADTERCMRGQFHYTFTQAETDVDATWISLTVSDDDTTIRTVEQTSDMYERAHDEDGGVGGATFGDFARGDRAILTSPNITYPIEGATGTVQYKDPDTGTVRYTVEITATGRGTVTPGDLT